MDDEAHPFDVAEEIMPQPRALARALDEPRDIGDDEAVVKHLHHAEIGIYRREMVVCDLRLCGSEYGEQSGFPDIGEAYQSHVGDGFEFQSHLSFLCDLAEL